MTNRRRRRRISRRKMREMRMIAIAAASVAVIMLVATVIILKATAPRDTYASSVMASTQGQTLELPRVTNAPTDLPQATAQLTDPPAMASVEPTAEATAEPTAQPTVQAFEYLPVIKHANITENKIAITVDDCFQMENLKHISKVAYNNGGKLTLFPIGKNVVRSGMSDILKVCVFNLGFEIENHTFNHARIFRLSEQEMAQEIWMQRNAVNQALGVNYEEHFFRLMGGDGKYDQRTHNYLDQLGFLGIADWSISGSDATMEQIKNALQPGAIYLFHTTDADTAKLDEFIPYAVSQGYQLVTMNELLGCSENAVSDLSTWDPNMPAPRAYTVEYREQKKGDYSWSVVCIQQKLYELGYLSASAKSALDGNPADGVYGDSTVAAIQAFQTASGLPATGVADVETQKRLLG